MFAKLTGKIVVSPICLEEIVVRDQNVPYAQRESGGDTAGSQNPRRGREVHILAGRERRSLTSRLINSK